MPYIDTTATIAKDGQTSGECDLGRVCHTLIVDVPTIDTAQVTLQAAKASGGTFKNVYITDPADGGDNKVITASGTGATTWVIPVGGLQFIKFYASAAQTTAAVTFYVRGIWS